MTVVIGVKAGQRHDPSGLCAAEIMNRDGGASAEAHFAARYLERLPAGTRFPEVACRVGEVVLGLWQRRVACSRIYLDATGHGQPLVDLFRQHARSVKVMPVYFTHGDRREADWQQVRLGKAYLVTRLQLLLQTHRLHLPRTPHAETLAQELMSYEIRLPPDANDRYGAFAVGNHDDLVTALGLAVQEDGRPGSGFMRTW
jgi:hypothetical protein